MANCLLKRGIIKASSYETTVLWTNSNPTSQMAGQVTLVQITEAALRSYDFIEVNYRYSTSDSTTFLAVVRPRDLIAHTLELSSDSITSGGNMVRSIYFDSSSSVIKAGYAQQKYRENYNETDLIPTSIIGYTGKVPATITLLFNFLRYANHNNNALTYTLTGTYTKVYVVAVGVNANGTGAYYPSITVSTGSLTQLNTLTDTADNGNASLQMRVYDLTSPTSGNVITIAKSGSASYFRGIYIFGVK